MGCSLKFLNIDCSVTNAFLMNIFIILTFSGILQFLKTKNQKMSLFLVPIPWQIILEAIYDEILKRLFDSINLRGEKYFIFLLVLAAFILFNNLFGLLPYSFTLTSHLVITFILSFSIFIGINLISWKKHKFQIFSLFLPANTNFFLALLLVPIEFISYIAKPISLGVRLFINLMAGHSLLKVIVGFAWTILLFENLNAIIFLLPLLILVLLIGLELGVALIQTYVFITLTCIYINDSEILAH